MADPKPPNWFPNAGTWVSASGDPPLRVEEVLTDYACVRLSDGLHEEDAARQRVVEAKEAVVEAALGWAGFSHPLVKSRDLYLAIERYRNIKAEWDLSDR